MRHEAECSCGAIYEVIEHESPVPVTGRVHCKVCGKKLDSWEGSNVRFEYFLRYERRLFFGFPRAPS